MSLVQERLQAPLVQERLQAPLVQERLLAGVRRVEEQGHAVLEVVTK